MTLRRVALGSLVATVALAGLVHPAAAGTPEAELSAAQARSGDRLEVSGSEWQPQTIVVVDVCGNEALDGAADCSIATVTDVGVQPDGTFSTLLPIAVPPSPCPCVVQISSTSEASELRLPLTIVGAPTAPPLARSQRPDIRRQLKVISADLEGWSVRDLLGVGAQRTLIVQVENVGDVVLTDVPLAVTAGRGDEPTGFVDAPEIASIQPGERQTLRVPVTFDPMAFGALRVSGSLVGSGEPVRFSAATSNPPVVPLVLAALVLQWVLLRGRNRLRRRIERRSDGPTVDEAPDGQEMADPRDEGGEADEGLAGDREDADQDVEPALAPCRPAVDLLPPEYLRPPQASSSSASSAEERIAQRRAAQVAEALIAAAEARSREVEERAAHLEKEASWRLVHALDVVAKADARAVVIQAEAEAAADALLRRVVEPPRPVGLDGGIASAVSKALAETRLVTMTD